MVTDSQTLESVSSTRRYKVARFEYGAFSLLSESLPQADAIELMDRSGPEAVLIPAHSGESNQ